MLLTEHWPLKREMVINDTWQIGHYCTMNNSISLVAVLKLSQSNFRRIQLKEQLLLFFLQFPLIQLLHVSRSIDLQVFKVYHFLSLKICSLSTMVEYKWQHTLVSGGDPNEEKAVEEEVVFPVGPSPQKSSPGSSSQKGSRMNLFQSCWSGQTWSDCMKALLNPGLSRIVGIQWMPIWGYCRCSEKSVLRFSKGGGRRKRKKKKGKKLFFSNSISSTLINLDTAFKSHSRWTVFRKAYCELFWGRVRLLLHFRLPRTMRL